MLKGEFIEGITSTATSQQLMASPTQLDFGQFPVQTVQNSSQDKLAYDFFWLVYVDRSRFMDLVKGLHVQGLLFHRRDLFCFLSAWITVESKDAST
jgi:hypothetical protein